MGEIGIVHGIVSEYLLFGAATVQYLEEKQQKPKCKKYKLNLY